MRSIRLFPALAVILGLSSGSLKAYEHVINQSAHDWTQAARTGRADVFILGDSVVANNGWMKAIDYGAHQTVDVAGTGLMDPIWRWGQSWGYENIWGLPEPWSADVADVPAGRQHYVWKQTALTAGSSSAGLVGVKVPHLGETMSPTEAFDFHVWTASPPGGGSMSAERNLGWNTTLQTVGPVATALPDSGLQHTVFSFHEQPGTDDDCHRFVLKDTTHTSVLYWRLLRPQASGATVSGWWWSGHSTAQLLDGMYLGGGTDRQGRVALLEGIVDRGSGKLNVMIYEGLNDRNTSAARFRGDVENLIGAVRSDWAQTARPADDLSFTVFGMYETGSGDQQLLRQYAQQLHDLALSDRQVSFIDVYEFGPSFAEGAALGYFSDTQHLSETGALHYGPQIMRTLTAVPEPTTFTLLGIGALGLLFVLLQRPGHRLLRGVPAHAGRLFTRQSTSRRARGRVE